MIYMSLTIFVFTCLWFFGDAQVSSVARVQPFPLEAPSVAQCCSFVGSGAREAAEDTDTMELLRCVNESASVQSTFGGLGSTGQKKKKVALLTYMSPETDVSLHFAVPDILEYGAYHAANTAVYAEHNDMLYRIATEEVGGNNEPADVRWNKVKLLMDALDPESESGWAKDAEFIVWLDADAIVLDLGFSVEALGEQFPHAHFIASADIRQGYINSGFLVLRNTPWLRKFLKDWWEISNRTEVCDQDAFDAVYTRYTVLEREGRRASPVDQKYLDDDKGRIEERVRILRRDALNSDPPATLRQHESNQVLHLMGESTLMRRTVFRSAFETTCRTLQAQVSEYEYLPSQLGQSRPRLYRTALDLYRSDTALKLEHLSTLVAAMSFPGEDSEDIGDGGGGGGGSGGGGGDVERRMVDTLALIAEAPLLFEGLGRSAHHLCDLLSSPDSEPSVEDDAEGSLFTSGSGVGANEGVACNSIGRGQVLATRREIFDLSIRWLDRTSAFLNALNSLIHHRALGDSGAQLDRRAVLKGRLRDGIVSFLHLLKRGAETGNDLFGSISKECHFPPKSKSKSKSKSNGESGNKEEQEEEQENGERRLAWSRQRLLVSEKVFALLRELDARVSLESRHVPRHMRALMHQNVAYLHFTVADHFLPASTPASAPASASAFADGDGDSDSDSKGLRDFHLYQAEQHALSSVHVFDHTFGDAQELGHDHGLAGSHTYGLSPGLGPGPGSHNQADRSTNEEHALSLQILAAIYCTDGRNVTLGLGVWERTIAKARDNLQGVSLGKPLERLADVYHNAAVCHLHAAQAQPQAQAQGGRGGERLFERASSLASKAVDARVKLQQAGAIPEGAQPAVPAHRPSSYKPSDIADSSPGVINPGGGAEGAGPGVDINPGGGEGALRLSLDLLDAIERRRASAADAAAAAAATTPASPGGSHGGGRSSKGGQASGEEEGRAEDLALSALRYLSELDEDEWEECEVGEEGCEAFIVDEDEDEGEMEGEMEGHGDSGPSAPEHQQQEQEQEDGEEEEEEDEEVAAARRRYAAQTSFLASSGSSG